MNPETLLPTLISRFQKIYFPRVSEKDLSLLLPEKFSAKEKNVFLRASNGSPGKLRELLGEASGYAETAKKMRTASAESRKKLTKEYLDNEEDPLRLIDAILVLTYAESKENTGLILKLLQVKRGLATLNLNPRLQLESIFS